ncbi:MAG: hypothetical protein ACOC33_00085 [bacterium]
MSKKLTTEEIIAKAKKVHEGKNYDYSNVIYLGKTKNIEIGCHKHGYFWQNAGNHLSGSGCPKCAGNAKITKDELVEKFKIIHEGKDYDYSQIGDFENANSKIKISCPEHGYFWQRIMNHLRGDGCPKCAGLAKLTKEDIIRRGKKKHNNFYDYSEIGDDYKNAHSKIKISCPEHGYFYQQINNHLNGQGCPKCAGLAKLTKDEVIEKSKIIHEGKDYDYSNVIYDGMYKKIKIGCIEHGYFFQRPVNHLRGQGCPKCANNVKLTKEDVIRKGNEKHNFKYDYSKISDKLENGKIKIKISCPEHGYFWQRIMNHLRGDGCPKCAGLAKLTKEDIIRRGKKKHNNFYDYSEIGDDYKNNQSKIKISCPEHGFFYQQINNHLNGQGCPKCRQSKGEKILCIVLEKFKINYIEQYKIKNKIYKYDFYLPEYNSVIEYHGKQHFIPIKFFGGEKSFKKQYKRDLEKYNHCKNNKIQYILIEKSDLKNIDKILLEKINSGKSSTLYENNNFEEHSKKYL